MTIPRRYPWRIFWVLLFLSIVGVAGLLPLIFALYRKLIAAGPLPMPLPILIAVQLMQTALVFAALIALGLKVAPKAGLEMPILQRWLYRSEKALPKGAIVQPLLAGVAAGALGLLIYYTFLQSRIPDWPVAAEAALPIWKRLLACVYGAINEEVLARLFAFSLVLWALRKIARQRTPQTSPGIFWIGNVIVSVLFVLGHLPSAKVIMPITPLLLVALFSINGLVSLMCGYLCWKRGLEAAMLAHFSTDFVLHVVGPMFIRG
ncbi:MAG TPA: CPBP family glutamic-type intramembrane protease [Chthoniobacterales bacterium]|nr:CPBP family glutamic-type intramembrane protease [Chthoniobacterales bacterium]